MLEGRKALRFITLARRERRREGEGRRESERETEIKEARGEGRGDNFKHLFYVTDPQYQVGFFTH